MKRFVRALFIGATLGLLCPPSLPAGILISNLGQAEGGGTAFNDTVTRDDGFPDRPVRHQRQRSHVVYAQP
jgi:hypothetical protein